jgi:hypothetical protein
MEYLFIIAFGWLVTEFEPLHFVLDAVAEKLPKNRLLSYLFGMFTCWQCTTFWTGLILTQDVMVSALCSLGAVIIDTWMQKR